MVDIAGQASWTVAVTDHPPQSAAARSSRRRRPAPAPRSAGVRSAVGAGLLSMLLPGLGQVWTGRFRRGLWWLAAMAMLTMASSAVVASARGELLELLVKPGALLWLIAANAAAGLFRVACALDASWVASRRRPAARSGFGRFAGLTAALLVIAALTAAPHAVAGFYGWQAHRVLTSVFAPSTPALATTPAVEPAAPAPSTAPPSPSADPTAAPTPAVSETAPGGDAPAAVPPAELPRGGRFTIALLGTDAGPGRAAARTDSMLIVTVDVASGEAAVFSAPRNLEGFPQPDGVADLRARHCPQGSGWQQLSAVYRCLAANPERAAALYPDAVDPAAAGVADTLATLINLPIDHYAVVNMGGFVDIVDAFGGVTVEVARPIRVELSPAKEGDDWQRFDLPAGTQRLDGRSAMAFVRSRTGSDDYSRMARQRCLVASLAAENGSAQLLQAFPALADALAANVATDIPLDSLPLLIQLRDRLDPHQIIMVGFTPPTYQRPDKTPDVERIRAVVTQAVATPGALRDQAAVPAGVGEACG
ncbi:MAG TPA: LCP family protein [Egibacteraceae bacterium]|nr:LCP family protein [Egibacteraceae bacterium]